MNLSELQRLEQQATNLRNSGQVDEAIEIYEQLAMAYTLNGETTRAAGIVQMIGVANKVANRTEQSLSRLDEAKRMYEEAGDPVGAGKALRDIAITYAYSGDFEAAEPILMQSIKQLKETEATEELAISEVKLGENYLKKGDLVAANEWISLGWEKLHNSNHWFYKMTALGHRAELAFAEQEFKSAVSLCEEAIGIIKDNGQEEGQKRRLVELYGLLALSKLARQEEAGGDVEMTEYYLSQLDDESKQYLLMHTFLKDLPSSIKG